MDKVEINFVDYKVTHLCDKCDKELSIMIFEKEKIKLEYCSNCCSSLSERTLRMLGQIKSKKVSKSHEKKCEAQKVGEK